jgi:hypothetical protein
MMPVIKARDGFSFGACAKNSSKLVWPIRWRSAPLPHARRRGCRPGSGHLSEDVVARRGDLIDSLGHQFACVDRGIDQHLIGRRSPSKSGHCRRPKGVVHRVDLDVGFWDKALILCTAKPRITPCTVHVAAEGAIASESIDTAASLASCLTTVEGHSVFRVCTWRPPSR